VAALRPGRVSRPARPIHEVEPDDAARRGTGVAELDRVLGGGVVAGAVVLLAGEPGVGKSTLLMEMAAQEAMAGRKVLYVSGEESGGQIRMRAERMGALAPGLMLATETDLAAVLSHIEAQSPDLLVVDSVQTVSSTAVDGVAGGVAQVRSVAGALTAVAKQRGLACVLVGHVTKDGSVAGPRTLEHIVDVVLSFEGDRHTSLRMLRAVKNRFGAVDEVGCFELNEDGITGLVDPSGLFLSQRQSPAIGTAVTVALEGRRPLVAEVQALVGGAGGTTARRITSGVDSSRVAMIAAVLDRRAGVSIGSADIYAASLGGVRLHEPGADLALAIAIATATADVAPPHRLVALGEVGLAGDIRPVPSLARRLKEAERLGFTEALVPPESPTEGVSMRVRPVSTVAELVRAIKEPASPAARN